jgi:hypothetical protein
MSLILVDATLTLAGAALIPVDAMQTLAAAKKTAAYV